MDVPTKKPVRPIVSSDAERRRIGKVVHDDRGNASVSWADAPLDYERTKLELLNEAGPTPRSEQGCDPYSQRGTGTTLRSTTAAAATGRTRTDLRRLSEHIKLMRELGSRKGQGEE